MAERSCVFLVPGFFGFANLGDLAYFRHVRERLLESLHARGSPASVHVVTTSPTASLPRRAARLARYIAATPEARDAELHLIGHSTGGLDARLLATPHVELPDVADLEPLASRVASVVTVASPHHGTPLAAYFTSVLGEQLLRVLSLATIYGLRTGRLPLQAVARMLTFFAAGGLVGRRPSSVLDEVFDRLLADFSIERRNAVTEFFRSVGDDRDLLPQLAPSAMALFDATTQDRPGVRYGCVVTRARPPGVRSAVSAGLDPYAHATHTLYVALHRLAGDAAMSPALEATQEAALRRAYGDLPTGRANDGIVPTLSQVHGPVVHAAWADHHDVIGHFDHPTHVPPHFDWLHSGTGFTRAGFDRLWDDVARHLIAAAGR